MLKPLIHIDKQNKEFKYHSEFHRILYRLNKIAKYTSKSKNTISISVKSERNKTDSRD